MISYTGMPQIKKKDDVQYIRQSELNEEYVYEDEYDEEESNDIIDQITNKDRSNVKDIIIIPDEDLENNPYLKKKIMERRAQKNGENYTPLPVLDKYLIPNEITRKVKKVKDNTVLSDLIDVRERIIKKYNLSDDDYISIFKSITKQSERDKLVLIGEKIDYEVTKEDDDFYDEIVCRIEEASKNYQRPIEKKHEEVIEEKKEVKKEEKKKRVIKVKKKKEDAQEEIMEQHVPEKLEETKIIAKEVNNKEEKKTNIEKHKKEKNKDKKSGFNKILNKMKEEAKNDNMKYETRDKSWLKFNLRILEMARDKSQPLMERMRFLAISSTNLDEFTMVRIPKLEKSISSINIEGKLVSEEVREIRHHIYKFMDLQNQVYNELVEELNKNNISIVSECDELKGEVKSHAVRIFDQISTSLTPLIFDTSRPVPMLSNKGITIGVMLESKEDKKIYYGMIRIPDSIPRVFELNDNGNKIYMLKEDLIMSNLKGLFRQYRLVKSCCFRILKDFDYSVSNNTFIVDNLKEKLESRENNYVTRIDIKGEKKEFTNLLNNSLNMANGCIKKTKGMIDLSFCMDIANMNTKTNKKWYYEDFEPNTEQLGGKEMIDRKYYRSIFNYIDDNKEVLLHHPYDSYDPVLDFIEEAANDPEVVTIKQTLYRVSKDSPIIKSLIKAARNGKDVIVVMEVKARFDEENNLQNAVALTNAGAHVIYGVPNMKVHSKLCLVVKRTKDGYSKEYAHIGTGNYNEKNAKIYTDISILTSKKSMTRDVVEIFNSITGLSKPKTDRIFSSPLNLRNKLIELIDKEIEAKKAGKKAGINIKVNALTDKIMIDKLYEAAENDVPVNLIVRSACCMKAVNNITIKSVVGRFLEHSRIYEFVSEDDIFISSADLMERNLDHRIEVLVKISKEVKSKLKDILNVYLNDNTCFVMDIDGNYSRQVVNAETEGKVETQEIFVEHSETNKKLNKLVKQHKTVKQEKKDVDKKEKDNKEKIEVTE